MSSSVVATQLPVSPHMHDAAISVRDVGKMYRIYDRPQDRLKQMLMWRFGRHYGREFWALRDISFEVRRGETVGIIGRNGSGKSTLLQIIAGTLAPSTGEVQVRGRVAALLELGSGFNPEFTGRENVYLNGAILGMSEAEIDARFESIAAFADIGEFIDQPVKLYSSGMVVRLAFAVQAHVDPEVLIVDEALAVGDMFFQAKCMACMRRLIDDGVTVLFVSHDIGAVKSLCRRALLLDRGRLQLDGAASSVAEAYMALKRASDQEVVVDSGAAPPDPVPAGGLATQQLFTANSAFQRRAAFQRTRNGKAHFANVQLLDSAGREIEHVAYEQEVVLRMAVEITEDIPGTLLYAYQIKDQHGVEVVYSDSLIEGTSLVAPRRGDRYVIEWQFTVSLQPMQYNITVALSIPIDMTVARVDFCDFVPLALQFQMLPDPAKRLFGCVHWDNQVTVAHYRGP
ncbi:MAG TPA: ABC transporter ATP-binding protein [Roseiflexaceae bacterium]|nr:ABC transporter ATP-binding protein [Roseiflexaceae bacterium]